MRGLVLSGGGARGFAHIGALEVFVEAGLDFEVVAGASMGAIVGALFAAGRSPQEILEIARNTPWLGILGFSFREALFSRGRLRRYLAEHLPQDFADLKRRLVVTAVEVRSGRVVYLFQGDLVSAVLASAAHPSSSGRCGGRASSSLTAGSWTTCPWTRPGSWGRRRSGPWT